MQFKKVETESYCLFMAKTKKFKTINFRFIFHKKFGKDDITKRNFLTDILTYSCNKYNTKRKLSLELQELYSATLGVSNNRFGNCVMSKFCLSLLNPKYTEKGMLEKSLDLLNEIIFHPYIINNRFDKITFDNVRSILESETKTIDEDSHVVSNIRLYENMTKKDNYRYHGYCYLDDLQKIDEENLYTYYQEYLRTNNLVILVVGDFMFNEMEKIIKSKIRFHKLIHQNYQYIIEHDVFQKEINEVSEKGKFKQSKLAIGCKIKKLNEFEYRYVSNMYNTILGGYSSSLLMNSVRQKESLVYYIYSNLSKADNLITINSGIDYRKYTEIITIIKKDLLAMRNGEFTEDELYKCKMDFISSIDTTLGNSNGLLDLILGMTLFDSPLPTIRKQKIKQVTKKDIMIFANKVYLDTIYLLRGE